MPERENYGADTSKPPCLCVAQRCAVDRFEAGSLEAQNQAVRDVNGAYTEDMDGYGNPMFECQREGCELNLALDDSSLRVVGATGVAACGITVRIQLPGYAL